MVGIFQIFGLNFLFWVIIGLLRFASEEVFLKLRKEDVPLFKRFSLSMAIGTVIGFILLILLFLESELYKETFETITFVVASADMLPMWLLAVAVGVYFSVRIYCKQNIAILIVIVSMAMIALTLSFKYIFGVLFAEVIVPSEPMVFGLWILFTFTFASLAGYIAHIVNVYTQKKEEAGKSVSLDSHVSPEEVAVVVAAHNEELTIGSTITSLLEVTNPEHIYVGSDGSTDRTVETVKSFECNVDDIQPNGGKAAALMYVLKKNDLYRRYKAVFFIDADITIDKKLFKNALPQFNDPSVAAVVAQAVSLWEPHRIPKWRLFFTAYRVRLWYIMQYCIRYGQTWKYTNVSPIVPGGCSIYRTTALEKIKIDAPGLIIEDFNMTFHIHHQHLGRIAFDPKAFVISQEPYSLRDYTRQIFRWYLGFFQTMRYHGIWPSWFFVSISLFVFEMLLSSILFFLIPFAAAKLLIHDVDTVLIGIPQWDIGITLFGIIVIILIADYIVTAIVAFLVRKPILLLYGIGFFFLRYIESAVFLYAMALGLFTRPDTSGKWKSPQRVSYGYTGES